MKEINYVDLGLESGIKWSDCYNSGNIFYEDLVLLADEKYKSLLNKLPTINDFEELRNNCKIKEYSKGRYKFLLVTGPNENKIRIFSGKWDRGGLGLRLFDYWIKNEYNDYNKLYLLKAIPILRLSYNYDISLIDTLCRKYANLIFVQR